MREKFQAWSEWKDNSAEQGFNVLTIPEGWLGVDSQCYVALEQNAEISSSKNTPPLALAWAFARCAASFVSEANVPTTRFDCQNLWACEAVADAAPRLRLGTPVHAIIHRRLRSTASLACKVPSPLSSSFTAVAGNPLHSTQS